nr:immunoglobulin light chain junction region [Macaca mulatta]
CQQGHNTPYSF